MESPLSEEAEVFFSLDALTRGLQVDNLIAPDEREYQLVGELCDFFSQMKELQSGLPEDAQPGGEWRVHTEEKPMLYRALLDKDIHSAASLLGNFWRNDLGVIVKEYATFPQLEASPEARLSFAKNMAHNLMVWTHLFGRPVRDLQTPKVGNPWGYLWEEVLIGPKVLRYNALARQSALLLGNIRRPIIAEIGAGYGGYASALLASDFSGTYIDFDLPETLVIAAYFLRKSLPGKRILLHNGLNHTWPGDLSAFDIVLSPNWGISALPDDSVDLFLNTFSLSEMGRDKMEAYIRTIQSACTSYFLHNNMDRVGVVNAGFERTPASAFPVSQQSFKLIYKKYDLFQQKHSGPHGDYREFLYQRV